jgi:uncharacterized protein involved in oxidation of intracellular sulfur
VQGNYIKIISMRKTLILLTIISGLHGSMTHAQCGGSTSKTYASTSIGIVIYSNDVETEWNALRFANFSKSQGDTVTIFLLGKGVELDSLVKKNNELKEQAKEFLDKSGNILGCGTCLASRKNNEPKICKFSSMNDMYDMIRKSKIVMTF